MTAFNSKKAMNPPQKTQVPLSAVIITLNEEKNIDRVIKSLTWVAEVVIYDSGSKDQTLPIAQKTSDSLGIHLKVYTGSWLGFGSTKAKASQLASHDWILSVDADEEIPEALQNEIRHKMMRSELDPQTAYQISRLSYYLGHWIRYGGWFPDRQIRLFNRQHSMWNQASIHEKVESSQLGKLENHMHHYVFSSIEHQVQTNNKYSSLQAQQMFQNGKKFSWFHFFTKPYVKFIECYFLKRGFLDGWPGYLIARNAAYSVLLKWSKLKEISDLKKENI